MAVTVEYRKAVLDDLEKLKGLSHAQKAGKLEQMFVRAVPVEKLHPNPDDEFSDPAVGPNYDIVKQYAEDLRKREALGTLPDMEPLCVQKLSPDGYMVLNGHHRWMAAKRVGIKKLPVRVVNGTTVEKIVSAVNSSENHMCVSFDLDEVLICDSSRYPADRPPAFPFSLKYRETIRENAGAMIAQLRGQGFDVWVYTGSYLSEEYIERLLHLHKADVSGIMNGMNRKKTGGTISKTFRKKYDVMAHVDNDSLIVINTRTKDYESAELPDGAGWAAAVPQKIRDLLGSMKQES